ncbi:dual specificity tyrosine-phosphorylation-regulated kinase 4 isoform X3 [Apteryx mantelli]|uniref:Dual specificity tyrosine-phosphorylation-regulated kinase 4 isoform X3 n=1 Tax=Apteryx mantelli TaxID=2696672 RepID=A0A8B7IZ75_9AVES|nr:PREDICTED: dual specificity tyrosine-phosphorylation-regulated kinase 4 isoform X2 [Apteryx mantelli mantelli]
MSRSVIFPNIVKSGKRMHSAQPKMQGVSLTQDKRMSAIVQSMRQDCGKTSIKTVQHNTCVYERNFKEDMCQSVCKRKAAQKPSSEAQFPQLFLKVNYSVISLRPLEGQAKHRLVADTAKPPCLERSLPQITKKSLQNVLPSLQVGTCPANDSR